MNAVIYVAANKISSFWQVHDGMRTREGKQPLSRELKSLIASMISVDENARPSFAEIAMHPWMRVNADNWQENLNAYRDQME